jgi:outer membrane receptor protein involved in Fe transport
MSVLRLRPFAVGFAAAGFASFAATAARADDTADLQAILSEHVITTASTTAQRASAAPALSTTITAEDLQLYGIRTLAEAIDFFSLGVVTANNLNATDIGSRGVLFEHDDGKHVLLLVNGHAINDPLYGAARFDQGAGVPIDLVDHIEVIVGPGSVLYGSNAMMAVVNVITKSAADYKGVHVLGEFEPGASGHGSVGTGFTFKLFGAPSEITAAFDYYQRFGPNLDFTVQRYPSVPIPGDGAQFYLYGPHEAEKNVWGGTESHAYFAQAPSAMMRFRSGDFEVNLMASTYKQGIPYATSSESDAFDDGDSYQLDRSLRGDVRHQAVLSQLVTLSSRVYADSYDRQRRVILPGYLALRPQAFIQYYDAGVARWAGIEERVSLNWLHDESLVTLIGLDARLETANAKEDVLDAGTGQYLGPTVGHIDTNATLIAPYVQQTYDPTKWLDLNAGARLDADSRYSAVVSPRAAMSVRPWENATIKADYSQAFRAPTWSETSLANYEIAPSSIAPETVRSVEASVEQRFGTHRVLIGVFRTWWDDLIEAGPLSNAVLTADQMQNLLPKAVGNLEQFRNLASVDNYGWNGSWDGALGHVHYGASATGAFTRQFASNVGSPLVVAPQIFGNARLSYVFENGLPSPALVLAFTGPRPADRLSPEGQVLPEAPALADLRFTLSGKVPGLKGLSYRASAEYVTASHGPYTAGPNLGVFDYVAPLPTPGFAPIDQFRAFIGLRYDFAAGAQAKQGEVGQ